MFKIIIPGSLCQYDFHFPMSHEHITASIKHLRIDVVAFQSSKQLWNQLWTFVERMKALQTLHVYIYANAVALWRFPHWVGEGSVGIYDLVLKRLDQVRNVSSEFIVNIEYSPLYQDDAPVPSIDDNSPFRVNLWEGLRV